MAESARMAGALADLLDGLDDEALAGAPQFLRAMAAGDPSPDPALDRLAAALQLSPLERDLVVLAGLPEEHEGYAGILRRLHPEGLPRPTTGLAAQLLGLD